ncbi:hypothetical protein S245_005075, partial [Arachis hypogaea]
GRCHASNVVPTKSDELVVDSDVEESRFWPNEGGHARHIHFESKDCVLLMYFNNDNCVKIEE